MSDQRVFLPRQRRGWVPKLLGVLALAGALASSPALAQGESAGTTYEVEGVDLALPAPPRASLVWQGKLYVALGAHGVAIFALPNEAAGEVSWLQTRALPGEAFEITLVGGRPWVMLNEARAIPLVDGASGAGAAVGGMGTSAAAASLGDDAGAGAIGGTVVNSDGGMAVIDGGKAQGIRAGDMVRIFMKVPVEVEGIEGGEAGLFRESISGVGRVEVLGDSRSQVSLYRGGRAQPGDRFEIAPGEKPPALLAPPRLSGLYEAGFDVRPFLAVGTLGVGTINEAWVSWISPSPWFADLRLQPLSAGWSREGNLLGLSATALAGYDNRFFAIGLGLGETLANTGILDVGISYDDVTLSAEGGDTQTYSLDFDEVKRGVNAAQLVRLGARDGFHFEVRNTFVLGLVEVFERQCETYYEEEGEDLYCETYADPVQVDSYRQFRWGSTQGRLVIPVADLTDLVFEGGGGATGYVYGSGGVQTWVRGNGDHGSLGLRVAAGYGLLAGDLDDQYVDLRGPLLSFGMRWRI